MTNSYDTDVTDDLGGQATLSPVPQRPESLFDLIGEAMLDVAAARVATSLKRTGVVLMVFNHPHEPGSYDITGLPAQTQLELGYIVALDLPVIGITFEGISGSPAVLRAVGPENLIKASDPRHIVDVIPAVMERFRALHSRLPREVDGKRRRTTEESAREFEKQMHHVARAMSDIADRRDAAKDSPA